LSTNSPEDWDILTAALNDNDRKWFVAEIFSATPVPTELFTAFVRAAIDEKDPSFNQVFVEPCIVTFGHRPVNEALLEFVEHGTQFEIARGVAALYWADKSLSRSAFVEVQDIWDRKRDLLLRTFINREEVQVRRQIISVLNLKETAYPDVLKPQVKQAIEIARRHSDDYIRHRVEVQLGNERMLKPIPKR
jgi:hypothetical protein